MMMFFGLIFALIFCVLIPAKMAEKRNREPLGWIVLSFFISPLWVYIILACIGKKEETKENDAEYRVEDQVAEIVPPAALSEGSDEEAALSPEEMLEKAKKIANEAHKGQIDLDGKPVILHPMNVAAMGDTVEEQICGWLHDVLEDSNYTPLDLLAEGISEEIVDTLQLLTHDKSEPYDDYVLRIARSGNRLAITTKLHDLQHNLARGKAGNHQKQVEKHSRVLPIIEQAYAELNK